MIKTPFPTQDGQSQTCPDCKTLFIRNRRDQQYCSPKCRKNSSQRKIRAKTPVNSSESMQKRRDNLVLIDKSVRILEMLYEIPSDQRLGFMKDLIDDARTGNRQLANILCNKFLLRASRGDSKLFKRKFGSCYTISQAAELYCQRYWMADVSSVVRNRVPDPATGEVEDTQERNVLKNNCVDAKSVVTIYNKDTLDQSKTAPRANSNRVPKIRQAG